MEIVSIAVTLFTDADLKTGKNSVFLGRYALDWHLGEPKKSVTDAVRDWRVQRPARIPLPHPSPRNTAWLRRNPWFEVELLPSLRERVSEVLAR